MQNILIFDIETIPDIAGAKRLNPDWETLTDTEVANCLFQQRRQENGSEFLRPYLHQVCAISVVLRYQDKLSIWSLGDIGDNESLLIQRFFDGLQRFQPTLVSWNGAGFDLPVLHYRALLHGINCQHYWQTGDKDPQFRYNNYLSRFHWRHIDLMDVLSGYQARMTAPLDQIATLLGYPGKMGMSGGKVWEYYQAGNLQGIRDYCETDVLNTYLVWLHFEKMRGQLTPDQFTEEIALTKNFLIQSELSHFQEFLTLWQNASS